MGDFGLSKITTSLSTRRTSASCRGTFAWIAPEVLEDEAQDFLAADVFSFGTVIFELRTNEIPWKDRSFEQVFSRIILKGECATSIHPIPEDQVLWRAGLMKLMHQCWERDPTMRPSFQQILVIVDSLSPLGSIFDENTAALSLLD